MTTTANNNQTPRLTVSNLSTSFPTEDGLVRSVADVSFSIQPGKTPRWWASRARASRSPASR